MMWVAESHHKGLKLRILPALALVAAATATPACADWQRASSPHFVIYANESPAKLKAFAEKLERFDKGVRIARSMKDPPVGDGGRLTVLVVPGVLDVQILKPGGGRAAGSTRRAIGDRWRSFRACLRATARQLPRPCSSTNMPIT